MMRHVIKAGSRWVRGKHSASPNVRARAVRALAIFGPDAIPGLTEALQNEHEEVRQAAEEAVEFIKRQN